MSLDVRLSCSHCKRDYFSANVTHNLNRMADAAGIYKAVWCPEEAGIAIARQLAPKLASGIELLKASPERFKALNPANGWGSYDAFVPWLERYLDACLRYPDAIVTA